MVRNLLLVAGLAMGASAYADVHQSASPRPATDFVGQKINLLEQLQCVKVEKNDGTTQVASKKASESMVSWRRPAGQFWGTGYSPEAEGWYYLTPLVIRPWVDYTFEDISTGVSGAPSWSMQVLNNPQTGTYDTETSDAESVTMSYIRYDVCPAPRLSYKGQITFPTQFDGETETKAPFNEIDVLPNYNIDEYLGASMAVSSHFWGAFARKPYEGSMGLTYFSGANPYKGMENGFWFGTNDGSTNAMATRFEKPDSPYLLNCVYWYGFSSGAITKKVPLKAYVFKTVDPAADYSFTTQDGRYIEQEGVELGELIAVADGYIPASRTAWEGCVTFEFKEKNPVTGAENSYSLEVDDDITIVVTGFEANLGNGTFISTAVSLDDLEDGHGNLGFLGTLEVTEDGNMSYGLTALKDFFSSGSLGNTTIGVLANVSYPWLTPYYTNQANDVLLPNDGETTDDVQGLDYYLYLMATSMTEEFEITFNGEEECEWLAVTDVYDDMDTNDNGEEEFTGITGLCFSASPNPTDESRTCVVNIHIPAANYEITFRQGTNNNAVEIVGAESYVQYFDLQGRRVANPEKGVFIKKAGNKTEKVIF